MLSFESDYIQGAHPEILNNLIKTNMEVLSGYGFDKYCESAKAKIKALCGEESEVFLLNGGTQTNQIVIDTMLEPYQGVICANTGHINTHEAGAIEFTGHKVLTLSNNLGKIIPEELAAYLSLFFKDENYEHCVIPGMVYISHPTEYGTLYTLDELKAISKICKEYSLKLYMDGARLGYALASTGSDVTIDDISQLCDAFYIGGTKVGALCGEAVVFNKNNTPARFFTRIKQHGALLAKGRLLGVQFDTLFTDDLYFNISKNAIEKADTLRQIFESKGYEFYIKTTTNQIFIVLDESEYEKLRKFVSVGFWERLPNNKVVVRFATSWATTENDINALINVL